MFNKKLQTQSKSTKLCPWTTSHFLWTGLPGYNRWYTFWKVQEVILLVASCCIRKKKSPYRKKNVVVWFWHKNSQDTLWDCQRLMEATWRLLCGVVSWWIFLGEHFMLFQDAVFLRYWKSRIWWKHPLRWPLERPGESLGMTFAGHHFEPVDYDFVHQDVTLL